MNVPGEWGVPPSERRMRGRILREVGQRRWAAPDSRTLCYSVL